MYTSHPALVAPSARETRLRFNALATLPELKRKASCPLAPKASEEDPAVTELIAVPW